MTRYVFGPIPDRYPQGKLSADDQGELEMAIATRDGKVVIAFPKPIDWVAMPPSQAHELAEALIHHANKIESGE